MVESCVGHTWHRAGHTGRDSAVEQRLVLSHSSRKGVLGWSCGYWRGRVLHGGSLFAQPGHLARLRASTEICDGRIKECAVGKGGQADDPHPGRETLANTALRDAADFNSGRSNQAKHCTQVSVQTPRRCILLQRKQNHNPVISRARHKCF